MWLYKKGVNGVNRLATKGEKYYRLPTKWDKNSWLPTWADIIDICFQKDEISRAFCIFSSLRSNHVKGNYRISCHLFTFWPEERGIILQNNFRYLCPRNLPLYYFQPRRLFIRSSHVSHGWNHKSDSEFFFRKGEEVAIELHRSRVPVDKDNHKRVFEFKKHLTEFLGLKEQALWFGIGGFSLKLFRPVKSSSGKCENFAIVTD